MTEEFSENNWRMIKR